MALFGNVIKRALFTNCLSAGILLATQSSLLAAPPNAPAGSQPGSRAATPTVRQPPAGITVGGLFGVMTEQQRASYQAAMRAMRPQLMEIESRIRAAHKDLLDTSLSMKFDENVIREKAMVSARLEAELTVLRVKAYSQIQPPLSPEQIERVKSEEPGPVRPVERFQRPSGTATNHDLNGLPPKK
jgi:Spy/CpxP family protein refolding chaperone